ncbi:hypothetical protein GWK47_041885 [Chionoecetes opilio]|uniref:Uncharacterized protein n=1 Tax=Chionoecetes opilio TaxID=41210 RepID=A0A8J5CK18_CHIOP|nr:hypothetical protein GWK47_041885 [Chionoecetes opilio]
MKPVKAKLRSRRKKVLTSQPCLSTITTSTRGDPALSPQCTDVDEVAAAAPPCLLFLMLEWPGSAPRRVLIHLGTDTPRARQFLLLCTGQRGPCYAGTKLFAVGREGQPGERVRGGTMNKTMGGEEPPCCPTLTRVCTGSQSWREMWRGCVVTVPGVLSSPSPPRTSRGPVFPVPCVFGKVVGGLEVVVAAVQHRPITEVSVVDCGAVLWE